MRAWGLKRRFFSTNFTKAVLTTRLNYPLDTVGKILYYLTMSEILKAIECDQCEEVRNSATMHDHEGLSICDDCWPEYAEENGLCESCGEPLPPIYENNGFTEPEGPSHWEIVGYKSCVECNQPDGEED